PAPRGAPRRHLPLEDAERRGEPTQKLAPDIRELPMAGVGGVREEVLGVVEKTHVERPEAEAVERASHLVFEELRVHAVPALGLVVDHLREGTSRALALHGEGEVLALHVPDLRDDDDLLAHDASPPDGLADNPPPQALAAPVGVVRRGVDEVDAGRERPLEGAPVDRVLVVDAVAPEAEAADREARAPQESVGRVAPGGSAVGVAAGP